MGGTAEPAPGNRNLSELAYDRTRRDILQGDLFPGDKLSIEAISERYGIGAVPIREALNRLSSEGLVERRSHRGFSVTLISMTELKELVKTRIWLETLALTKSIKNHDVTWDEQLVVSFHRLARAHRRLPEDSSRETTEEWDARHKDFHMLLLARCKSSWLVDFCSTLMDQAVRYRNLSMNTNPNRQRRESAAAEHSAILDAVLDHDTPRACALLDEHYRVTLESLRPVLDQNANAVAPVAQKDSSGTVTPGRGTTR